MRPRGPGTGGMYVVCGMTAWSGHVMPSIGSASQNRRCAVVIDNTYHANPLLASMRPMASHYALLEPGKWPRPSDHLLRGCHSCILPHAHASSRHGLTRHALDNHVCHALCCCPKSRISLRMLSLLKRSSRCMYEYAREGCRLSSCNAIELSTSTFPLLVHSHP